MRRSLSMHAGQAEKSLDSARHRGGKETRDLWFVSLATNAWIPGGVPL